MHNHFLVKSLALTRPGGLVAALTSRYTMDAQDDSARREMAGMADLVTAIRLPSGAHRKAAGTEAVTDLMLFRRRDDGQPRRGADWERAFTTQLDGGTARVSEYFKDHPENVLGQLAVDGGQYSSEELVVRPRADLARVPEELADRLAVETARAHEARLVLAPRSPEQKMAEVRSGGGRVSMRIVAREASRFEGTITANLADGTFTVLRNGDAEPWPCPASQQAEAPRTTAAAGRRRRPAGRGEGISRRHAPHRRAARPAEPPVRLLRRGARAAEPHVLAADRPHRRGRQRDVVPAGAGPGRVPDRTRTPRSCTRWRTSTPRPAARPRPRSSPSGSISPREPGHVGRDSRRRHRDLHGRRRGDPPGAGRCGCWAWNRRTRRGPRSASSPTTTLDPGVWFPRRSTCRERSATSSPRQRRPRRATRGSV